MPRTRIGPFALEETLDRGQSANVLRGLHMERKESMAVKLLPASLVQRPMGGNTFVDDVKRLQRLIHPAIVRTLGGAVEGGQPYLVMEYVPGESVRDLLDRRGKLPWELAVEIVDGICVALKFAHEHGFVHQRLTPSRVILVDGGGVKLTGFDCVWADRDEVLGLRVPMDVANYLAPEEFRGTQSASLPPCDLFSVGVILYECLTGTLPWTASSPGELVQVRRACDAPRVSSQALDCPVWLDRLAARLLTTKRADRLSSAEEAHRAIVTAMHKAAAGISAAQQALSGRASVLQVDSDQAEINELRHKLRSKPRDESPFYERAWFLALCLGLLVSGGVWSLWPPSEDTLYAKAVPLMQSDNPVDWKHAEESYIKPLLERFPSTKYLEKIQPFLDKLAMDDAADRARNNERLGRPAQSEAERLYTEAWKLEKMGDRISAWEHYESVIRMFGDSTDRFDKAYVGLARMRINVLRSDTGPSRGQAELLREKLDQASALADQGELFEARKILDSIVSSYTNNRELRPFVDQARAQINKLSGAPKP